MNRREDRKNRRNKRRAAAARAYDKCDGTEADFRVKAEYEAEALGISPTMIFAFIKVAIALYKLWKAYNCTAAPSEPYDDEPGFDE